MRRLLFFKVIVHFIEKNLHIVGKILQIFIFVLLWFSQRATSNILTYDFIMEEYVLALTIFALLMVLSRFWYAAKNVKSGNKLNV
jgi:hypothetical protein